MQKREAWVCRVVFPKSWLIVAWNFIVKWRTNFCSWISSSMILEIKGSSDIRLQFEGLVLNSFLNKGFKFAILKGSRKLPNLIERLQSSLIDKTREPSFRKRPKRSSVPAALRTFVLLKIFFISIYVVYVKWKATIWIKCL